MKSLAAMTLRTALTALLTKKQSPESVVRLQLQVLDGDPIELGHITAENWQAAVPDNTGAQCKNVIYQLLIQSAEKWKSVEEAQ